MALLLLLRVPLVPTFRAALVLLAALEVLAYGRRELSGVTGARERLEIAVKLALLAAAYVALSA